MRESIEQADVAEQTRQQQWQQTLRQLARDLQAVESATVRTAQSAAEKNERESGSESATPITESIRQARQQIETARRQAESARPEQTLRPEFQELARSVATTLKQAGESLREASKQSAAMAEGGLRNDDRQKDLFKEMQRLQQSKENEWLRNLGQQVKQSEGDQRNADRAATEAERQARDKRQQLEKATEKAKEKPEDTNAQKRVAEAAEQSEVAAAKADATAAAAKTAARGVDEARSRLEQQKAVKPADLNVKNPAAALAAEQTDRAAGQLDRIRQSLGELSKAVAASPLLSLPPTKAEQLARSQEQLAGAVDRTAEELDRAAAAAADLDQPDQAKAIGEQSAAVRQIADDPMRQAARSLPEPGKANAADQQLAQSARQLRQAAEQAGQLAEQMAPAADQQNSAASQSIASGDASSTPPADPSGMSPQAAARALDQMRRAEATSADNPAAATPPSLAAQAQQSAAQAAAAQRRRELAAAIAGQTSAAGQSPGQPSAGQPTDSDAASQPQGPPVDSLGGGAAAGDATGSVPTSGGDPGRPNADPDWAMLRDRSTDQTRGAAAVELPPGYRDAAAAYFQAIAEESGR